MKLAIALLALVAAATAKIEIPNFGKGALHDDIQEFLNLMPADKIVEITLKYAAEDNEFKNMIKYFQGEEFKGLAKDVEDLSEIRELMNYIENAGIRIYDLVNMLNDAIGLPRLTPPQIMRLLENSQTTGGIRGYVDAIMKVLPKKELEELYKKKLTTSKSFADLVKQLQSENFQKIVNDVYLNPKFQNLLKKAEKAGINLELIKDLLKTILGINIPPRPSFNY